ncbi:hypothetical protein K1719_026418 [Acacia pycnantha]|nr:hypothetical protein K1719_026418 [Acacia pycnantha]
MVKSLTPGFGIMCTTNTLDIQKIIVFEGTFEKIFSIIKEKGDSDGGVVVQAMRCIGDLIAGDSKNLDSLGRIFLEEEPQVEPALL